MQLTAHLKWTIPYSSSWVIKTLTLIFGVRFYSCIPFLQAFTLISQEKFQYDIGHSNSHKGNNVTYIAKTKYNINYEKEKVVLLTLQYIGDTKENYYKLYSYPP